MLILAVATMFLQWQHPTGRDSWLDCAKLGTLGMECDVPSSHSDAPRHYARMLPRRVLVAFELGGAAWEKLMAERDREIAPAAFLLSRARSACWRWLVFQTITS